MTEAIMTVNEIRAALLDRNLKAVAKNTGIRYEMVYRFTKGISANPRVDVVIALSRYLQA
jgi:DNA-binding phage protein